MSQQKKKKTVALAAIIAVVAAVAAGFALAIPHIATVTAISQHDDKSTSSNENHNSDSIGSNSLGHVGMMRTINNTNCIPTPGGPQVC